MKRRNFLQALGLAAVVPAIPKIYYRHEDVPEVPEMEVVQEMIVKRETNVHSDVFEQIEITLTNAKEETLKNVNGWATIRQEHSIVNAYDREYSSDEDWVNVRASYPTRTDTKLIAKFDYGQESRNFLNFEETYSFEIKNPTAIIKGNECMLVDMGIETSIIATFLLQTPITVELINT